MTYSTTDPTTGARNGFHMRGTDQELWEALSTAHPEIAKVHKQVSFHVPTGKRAVEPYQAAALYVLAKPYANTPHRILEIGTFLGFSAAWIASACPTKRLITLNPKDHEREQATTNLRTWPKVQVLPQLSWDYLAEHDREGSPRYDLIFIDGDHKHVRADLPWLTFLEPGGLLLFHDWSPEDARHRPCPPVWDAVNELAAKLRPETRTPDVTIIDQHNVGMAGFYKRPTDHLSPTDPIVLKGHPLLEATDRAREQAAAMHNS